MCIASIIATRLLLSVRSPSATRYTQILQEHQSCAMHTLQRVEHIIHASFDILQYVRVDQNSCLWTPSCSPNTNIPDSRGIIVIHVYIRVYTYMIIYVHVQIV